MIRLTASASSSSYVKHVFSKKTSCEGFDSWLEYIKSSSVFSLKFFKLISVDRKIEWKFVLSLIRKSSASMLYWNTDFKKEFLALTSTTSPSKLSWFRSRSSRSCNLIDKMFTLSHDHGKSHDYSTHIDHLLSFRDDLSRKILCFHKNCRSPGRIFSLSLGHDVVSSFQVQLSLNIKTVQNTLRLNVKFFFVCLISRMDCLHVWLWFSPHGGAVCRSEIARIRCWQVFRRSLWPFKCIKHILCHTKCQKSVTKRYVTKATTSWRRSSLPGRPRELEARIENESSSCECSICTNFQKPADN